MLVYIFFTVLIKEKFLIYVQQPYLYTLKEGEILCTKLGRLPRLIICNVSIRFTFENLTDSNCTKFTSFLEKRLRNGLRFTWMIIVSMFSCKMNL